MIELLVTGMTCSGCVASVRRALERVLPNAQADIELSSGRLRLDAPGENAERLRSVAVSAIEDAGFGVQP